jgi:hypothetical protein
MSMMQRILSGKPPAKVTNAKERYINSWTRRDLSSRLSVNHSGESSNSEQLQSI